MSLHVSRVSHYGDALFRPSLLPSVTLYLGGIWELRFVGIVRVLCFNTFTPTANVKSRALAQNTSHSVPVAEAAP